MVGLESDEVTVEEAAEKLQKQDKENDESSPKGNKKRHTKFTRKEKICLVGVILLIVIGLLLVFSIIAMYVRRLTDNSKCEEKVLPEAVQLICYQCSWSVNLENKSPFLKHPSCPSNPTHTVQCQPGDYCGLRYLEYFETGSKFWERTCLKRAKLLRPGEYSCLDETKDDVNHTICRCNKNFCLIKKFELI